MAAKSNTSKPKRRASRANKKLKTGENGKQKHHNLAPQPSSPESSSSSGSDDQASNKADTHNKDNLANRMDDEPSTQSFSDRLKILNLQTDPSNELPELNDSEDQSQPEEDQGLKDEVVGRSEEGLDRNGLATKMLKAKTRRTFDGSFNGSDSINPTMTTTTTTILPVGSLAQTLTQALKSNDTKLLETCFLNKSKNNRDLIANTIQRLPKTLLHNLIDQIVICLNRKKRGYGDGATTATVRRTKTLIEWIRQILLIHMSYLLAVPTLASQLTILHASLQKRLNLHNKLLTLNGRLELVLSQIELNKNLKEFKSLTDTRVKSNGISKSKKQKNKINRSIPEDEAYQYAEEESPTSDEEQAKSQQVKQHQDSDNPNSMSEDEDQTKSDSDQSNQLDSGGEKDEEEGSVEEVVLRSGSDGEDSESSEGDDKSSYQLGQDDITMNDLLQLEAEESPGESASDDDDDDDDDDEDEEDGDEEDEEADDVDGSMEGFIDDGPLESSDSDE